MQTERFFIFRKALLQAVIALTFLASCEQGDGAPNETTAVKQTNIVAGPGEKTFSEKYRLSLTLPLPEAKFLALLDRLKLSYEVCGIRGTDLDLPLPRQHSKVDLSKADKCYEIDGEVDSVQHIGERYRAFVDGDHRVIYIENAFSYTGP